MQIQSGQTVPLLMANFFLSALQPAEEEVEKRIRNKQTPPRKLLRPLSRNQLSEHYEVYDLVAAVNSDGQRLSRPHPAPAAHVQLKPERNDGGDEANGRRWHQLEQEGPLEEQSRVW